LATNLLSTILFALMLVATYELRGGAARLETSIFAAKPPEVARFRLTTRRVAIVGVTGLVLSAFTGVCLIRTIRADQAVAVIAHRGASASAPENTLASLQAAIDQGADWVEIDVQETADGEVVVFHDSDFMKLAGNPLKIWDATTADLEAIDIGSSFSFEYRNERVPRLADALELCGGRVGVLIELKYYGHDVRLEQRVLDQVENSGTQSQVMYMSLKAPAVEKLKALAPQVEAGILMSVAAGDLKQTPADFLAINAGFVNRRVVKEAHSQDRLVYVWTINDALTMSRMIGLGVDGVITDNPALARSVIRERGQLEPTARLLLELADLFGLQHKAVGQ
ncbi:MAG: glycerophosphodiester phosphodiesterase, partial [Planctomycetota bacterium]